jgi:hypothetical protein
VKVERVQRWVMSGLILTTATIFASGLCFLASVADGAGAKPGLLIISALVGLVTMIGVRLLNQLSPVSGWVLLGLIPAVSGWYWLYLR